MYNAKILFLHNVILFFIISSFPAAAENMIEDFAVYTVSGERQIFSEILSSVPGNEVLMINFTSIDCNPCRKEIPELKILAMKYKDRVKLICVYSETGKPVQELAESLGVSVQSFVDPFGKIRTLFDVKKVPVTFVVDRNRRIMRRFDGYTLENMRELKTILKELNS